MPVETKSDIQVNSTIINSVARRSIFLSVVVALLLSIYGVLPSLLRIKDTDASIRYFPPFALNSDAIDLNHMGAEYWNVAKSVYRGDGFTSPFGIPSGPTAWMPPALCVLLAGMLWITGGSEFACVCIYVVLNIFVFALMAYQVSSYFASRMTSRFWILPLSVFIVLMANFNDNFQRTHDGTWLLLLMQLILIAALKHEDRITLFLSLDNAAKLPSPSNRFIAYWGILGGVASLSSPAILLCWIALTFRWMYQSLFPKSSMTARSRLKSLETTLPYIVAILLAFALHSPWLIRNYVCFHRIVAVKPNGLFELEQSLLRTNDGIMGFESSLEHPFFDPNEARKHATLGETEYIRERTDILKSQFLKCSVKYATHCFTRFAACLVVHVRFTAGHESSIWIWIQSVLFATPMVAVLARMWYGGSRVNGVPVVAVILIAYLLPYCLVSYYSRYQIPMMGVRVWLLAYAIYSISFATEQRSLQPHHGETSSPAVSTSC